MAKEKRITSGVVRMPLHVDCWACGPDNGHGLRLDFTAAADGSVTGAFACDAAYTGYPGFIQGGVTAALLDSAMTNCLYAHGHEGVTADLRIRYLRPLLVGKEVTVRAWLERSRRLTHELGADLVQDGLTVARAEGKFMQHPG